MQAAVDQAHGTGQARVIVFDGRRKAIAKSLQSDPDWKPFFDGVGPVRRWLQEARPDVVVLLYNDHGLNFFLDKMPTFSIGAASEYRNADEGWGIPTVVPFPGHPALSWYLIESLVGEDFDLEFMDSLVGNDPRWACQYDTHQLVELTGTQGVELLMWLATRATLGERVRDVHRNYHIPISNTASGWMLMTPA